MICIDSLHSAAANLTSIRQALLKLFRSENRGDSQYTVLAVGTSTRLVQSATSDPKQVLEAIQSKDFQKIWIASRKDEHDSDLVAFRRRLDEIRTACDAKDPLCSMKRSLPGQVKAIASEEKIYNIIILEPVPLAG